jgi:hypothetical protein
MMGGVLTVCLAEAAAAKEALKTQALELREEESAKEDDSISNGHKLG